MSGDGAPILAPVKREPAAIVIARRLTEAVMDGTLPPGRQLGEVELAAQLGVSRGPLREAMQRLVQQGILRSEPHRGVFVVDLTPEDVTDIYLARTAVESAACRIVIRRHPQRTADRLAAACAAMAAAADLGDPGALAAADMELHHILIAESGSRRLGRMADTLFVETRMCLSALTVTYHDPVDLVAEHTAIIDALRAADEDLLIELLDAHMRDALARLLPPDAAAVADAAAVPDAAALPDAAAVPETVSVPDTVPVPDAPAAAAPPAVVVPPAVIVPPAAVVRAAVAAEAPPAVLPGPAPQPA
ncbi:GntR family transcriptional regulator [Streptantibioticus silvisoli]|uniref:GntR family transcriptional regulator n=1 Tax=Streptantibioticus silvisoli TaxID=2705255 RepID=A0ABT6W8X9_9ACTN|nr:GntR family transcriptional regulator [Streptantibioticus silvisoli]MDI5967213.1 GntR family transcriptional regulator [Streptantibioticus silvisoli]